MSVGVRVPLRAPAGCDAPGRTAAEAHARRGMQAVQSRRSVKPFLRVRGFKSHPLHHRVHPGRSVHHTSEHPHPDEREHAGLVQVRMPNFQFGDGVPNPQPAPPTPGVTPAGPSRSPHQQPRTGEKSSHAASRLPSPPGMTAAPTRRWWNLVDTCASEAHPQGWGFKSPMAHHPMTAAHAAPHGRGPRRGSSDPRQPGGIRQTHPFQTRTPQGVRVQVPRLAPAFPVEA